MLIFLFTFALNSISLLLSSSKSTLKFRRSLSDSIENGKQRCLLLFISFCSSNVALIHKDCLLISFQLFIYFMSIIRNIPYILLLIRHCGGSINIFSFSLKFSKTNLKPLIENPIFNEYLWGKGQSNTWCWSACIFGSDSDL